MIFLALGIANSGDATEINCLNYVLSSDEFQYDMLGNDLASNGALFGSSIYAGMLFGGLLTGLFGDNFGRKPILLTGLISNSCSGALSAFAPNFGLLCFFRFISGLGIGAVITCIITLATELSPPSRRGLYVTFVSSFWTIGSIFISSMGWIVLGIEGKSWRFFLSVAAIPSSVGFALVACYVPESPRFLALNRKYVEATKAANIVADAMGFRGVKLGLDEVRHYYDDDESNNISGELPQASTTEEAHESKKDKKNIAIILRQHFRKCTKELNETMINAFQNISGLYSELIRWRKTIPLQVLWFCMSFGSGLVNWIATIFIKIGLVDVYFAALLFAMANLPGNIATAYLLDRVGRKTVLMSSMLLAALSLLTFAGTVHFDYGQYRNLNIVLSACFFHAFMVCGWCTISVMTGELFPTTVRNTGLGICTASGRIAAMIVQFVNGSLVETPDVLLIVSSVVILIGALTPFLMKMEEMSLKPLSDDVSAGGGGDGAASKVPGDEVLTDCPTDHSDAITPNADRENVQTRARGRIRDDLKHLELA